MRRNIVLWLGRYVTVVGFFGTLVDVVAGDAVARIASGVAGASEGSIGVGAEGAGLLHTSGTTGAAVGKCLSRHQSLQSCQRRGFWVQANRVTPLLSDFDA